MHKAVAVHEIINNFKSVAPKADFWSLRLIFDQAESVSVRENVVQPPHLSQSRGANITLVDKGGFAYAATCDLSRAGFEVAVGRATQWLEASKKHSIVDSNVVPRPKTSGVYQSPVLETWDGSSLGDKISILRDANRQLKIHDCIVDWEAHLAYRQIHSYLTTSDDVLIEQTFNYIMPGLQAVANKDSETQRRTGGGWGTMRQGGLEQLAAFGFPRVAKQVAEQAIELVNAPQCPGGAMSLLLMPSQMMLQIHESIGHPLEMDRILGDERNYAGTSFVNLDMVGNYQYGSQLLNVTYDPQYKEQMASYGFDDEGSMAVRTYIIRDGILECLLGGAMSQARARQTGVANARASDWNRPPIDRMANLNLEPGSSSMDELIGSIENGVLMDTNLSWSIDDSRNKFQFGCELGKIIRDGEIKETVKNPNYRGVSATFWRNLAAVGDTSTFEIWGTPYCGKGEPNQMVHVGHASPACVFNNVEVFGGA